MSWKKRVSNVLAAAPVTATEGSGIEVVTDPERFEALKSEWDALWLACRGKGVYQSFDCCLNTWQTIAEPARRKLFCLVGWEQGRMVMVWALTTYRNFVWKYARPLDASGAEYTDILISETVDQKDWIDAAWQVVLAQAKSDVALLPYVQAGTAVNTVLSGCSQKASFDHDVCVHAHLKDEESWQTYSDSISGRHRQQQTQLRRRQRQLAALGALDFEIVEGGDARCPELIRWMLAQKRIWAERAGKKGEWLFSDAYRDFLIRLLADAGEHPRRFLMCLTLNGAPIVVKVVAAGENILELLIAGFDAEYEKYSPGNQLDEYMVRWALEHKLDVDFGNGGERYKKFWARDYTIRTATYHIPLTAWGRLALYLRTQRQARRNLLQRTEDSEQLPSTSQP